MSFALHHLKADDKAELIKQAHRLLEKRYKWRRVSLQRNS